MTNGENVCAIILDYDGAEKTGKCLESLIDQGIRTVYLLDNGASETSSLKLRTVVDKLRTIGADYSVQLLCPGKNLGFGRGVNFVLSYDRRSECAHDYYLLLNNDALAGPGLVSALIAVLKQNADAALVAPRIISSDVGREQGIWYHRYFGLLLARPGRFCFHYFTGCCLLFSKDLTSDSGLFDEAFFMYGEDAELGWRLTRQGRKMICATNVFVRHDLGPSVHRASLFYDYHMIRSHLLLTVKTSLHPVEIPFLLLTKSSGLGFRALLRCFRYRSLIPLGAFLLASLRVRINKP